MVAPSRAVSWPKPYRNGDHVSDPDEPSSILAFQGLVQPAESIHSRRCSQCCDWAHGRIVQRTCRKRLDDNALKPAKKRQDKIVEVLVSVMSYESRAAHASGMTLTTLTTLMTNPLMPKFQEESDEESDAGVA